MICAKVNPQASLQIVGLGLASSVQAQTSPYYIVAGDQQLMTIVQNGALVQTISVPTLSYPIAVRNTVWLGDRDDNGGTEYTLAGAPTGNTSAGGGKFSQLLDGTTDGTHNYGMLLSGPDAVTVANLDWSGQSILFTLPASAGAEGITYDPNNNHLFLS